MIRIYIDDIRNYSDDFFYVSKKRLSEFKSVEYKDDSALKESVLAWKILFDVLKDSREDIKLVYGDKGKPYLKNSKLHFNISHSRGRVMVCISDCEIGADIEYIDNKDRTRLYSRVLNEKESEILSSSLDERKLFYKFWTLKESILKYNGKGLSGDLKKQDFSANINDSQFSRGNLHFFSFEDDGFYISVCNEKKDSVQVIYLSDFIKNK